MAAISGFGGGKAPAAYDPAPGRWAVGALRGTLDPDAILAECLRPQFPPTVTVVVNNACNLHCRHCYLQVDRLERPPLSDVEWSRLFTSIAASPTRLLSFSGKEVFLGPRGARLIEAACRARDTQRPGLKIGVITNGTLLQPFRGFVLDAGLSYLDISVDGLPALHDAIRGPGAFEALRPNLVWAAKALGDRCFASTTIQSLNWATSVEHVLHLNHLGVRNVGLALFHPASRTSRELELSPEQSRGFFENLEKLADAMPAGPLTVLVEVDTLAPDGLHTFLSSSWCDLDALDLDEHGVLWNEHVLPNGIRLQFKVSPTPSGVSRAIRITPEGLLLASDDIFRTHLYPVVALTDLRSHAFDLPEALEAARRHPRVARLFADYTEHLLPRLQSALMAPVAT